MTVKLSNRLRERFSDFTNAEKAIASFMLTHLADLPFETAASIAGRVGVSQMTVGRFLRTLGYGKLSELKEELRNDPGPQRYLVSDRAAALDRVRLGDSGLKESLDAEIASLVSVYEQVGGPAWNRAVAHLASADGVYVTGFQTLAGIAADFAARMEYLRPGVRMLDGRDGTFSALFAGADKTPCLVLLEMRRYTRLSHLLAHKAVERGVALIIICDSFCYWARDYTDLVLSIRTETRMFWDSQAPFASLTNLLMQDVIVRLGDAVAERTRRMSALQESFDAFQD